jgi:lysine 2,3-aminomutase
MLADIGIPLGSQTVLLKGVNDDSATMKELMQKLLKNRIKPYYIYQADMTEGTDHLRTSVQKGLDIMKDLMGHTSGMAVPYFVIDAPGGGGKVRLLPNSVIEHTEDEVVITNFEGKVFRYSQRNGKNAFSNGSNTSIPQNQDTCQLPV